MGRKRHKPEEIVAKLRQVDVLTAQSPSVAKAVRSIGVTEVASRLVGSGSNWRIVDPPCEPVNLDPNRKSLVETVVRRIHK